MANFSDVRCAVGGVCPNDSLVFTCEVHDAPAIRVFPPTGGVYTVNIGNEANGDLPPGFSADSLVIAEDAFSGNFTLTLSIENAFLLNGGNIACDDSINPPIMAGCQLAGEPSVHLIYCEQTYITGSIQV